MFASFARRITTWYVVAATVLVAIVLGMFAALALAFYVRLINDGVDDGARAATLFAARAAARHDPFVKAAIDFETRDRRSGVRVVATQFGAPPPPDARRSIRGTMVLRPDTAPRPGVRTPPPDRDEPHPILSVVHGKVVRESPRALRIGGNHFGFAVATLFGGHFARVPFLDGDIFFAPDPQALERATLVLLGALLVVSAAAGCLAWFAGRYITTQALRPLYDVTVALQRFAARDFTPQSIAVAGKSEFDAVALAYNAAAAQVATAFAEREQAENQMRQFVADAGHELRTPLTIVLGYIDLLRRRVEPGDERSRRIFAAVGSEGARMRTLIDNLVLLARMEGADERPVEPFRLAPLIEEVVEARRIVAPTVPFELDLDVDGIVIGARNEIHEAISNVVDNALKYAPGSPIRIATSAGDGNAIEVAITDRGPGIPPEDRAAIFERFYRGVTRGEVEGSGLGLAIAKRALERAGGELALTETSPRGTTFTLRMRTDGRPTTQPRTSTA